MVSQATPQEIESARAYASLFVPALFQSWAPEIIDLARLRPGHRVLDVACGTGVLSRAAATRVGEGGRVTGLDPAPGMLHVARESDDGVQWVQGVAADLPFEDQSFDAVVSQFGMMFFPDPLEALRAMKRVLVPGGRLAVAVWDEIENNSAYANSAALLDRRAGKDAADALSIPYNMGDRDALTVLGERADLEEVRVDTIAGEASFPSVRVMAEADLYGWLPLMGVNLDEATIDGILREAEEVHADYVDHQGRVTFPVSAHVLSARKA